MNYLEIVFAIINVAVLAKYFIDIRIWKNKKDIIPLAGSVITGVLVIALTGETGALSWMLFALWFAVVFAIAAHYYSRNLTLFLLMILVAIVELFYVMHAYHRNILYPFIQMFAIGTAYGTMYSNGSNPFEYRKRTTKSLEVRRDIFHVFLGIVIMAIFLMLNIYHAIAVVIALIMIGYVNNAILLRRGKGRLYRLLMAFERSGTSYGLGALYLGIGAMLLIGFIHNLHFLLVGFAALLLADPIATIVGMNLDGIRLFYNRRKSLLGTVAFFLVVAILGYPFIGYYSLVFGLCLAIVESIDFKVDDNITIAAFMILAYVLYLFFVGMLPALAA